MRSIISSVIAILAIIGVVIGISKINDDYNKRYFACEQYYDIYVKSFERCVAAAWDDHNKEVNEGWAYTIISAIIGIGALGLIEPNNKNPKAKKH